MADYDFHKLSPFDFERMCCELLRIRDKLPYHTFREGQDGGIDILKSDDLANAVVYQCKRYADRNNLFQSLLHDELPKVRRLNPSKYGVITSLQLTAQDKQKIKDAFSPYIKSLDSVIDGCDLNALLDHNDAESVVSHYPALWLSGFHVMKRTIHNDIVGRSEDFVKMILDEMKCFIWTDAAEAASQRLEQEHVVVLTGDPGIGKTTTAKMLLAWCAGRGFEPIVTFKDITELESLFVKEQKQVFFFDDFLGQQMLEATLRPNDRGVCEFIRRVQRDAAKRFILTSRTVIINHGICSVTTFKNFWRVTPSYFYCVCGYSNFDRARILHSHMLTSLLPSHLLEQLLTDRSYWKIIEHRNFNPRIVDLILSNGLTRKLNCWDKLLDVIIGRLNSPEDIWKDAFEHTLTPEERLIVWCVFLLPDIEELSLHRIFSDHLVARGISSVGDVSFDKSIETLADSMLTRKLDFSGKVTYVLRNPAVGDFLLARMNEDVVWVKDVLPAIHNYHAVDKLREFSRNALCDKKTLCGILLSISKMTDFAEAPEFVIALWRAGLELDSSNACVQITGQIRNFNLEQTIVGNCDCLIWVLGTLDDNSIDLIRECGLSLATAVLDEWIQGCEEFESVARAYKLVVKYQVKMPPNMSTCLTNCVKTKAWDIAGELPDPEYETDEYGRQYIADGEADFLRDGIEAEIRRTLLEYSVPESMVDIWDCAREPDLDQIFSPPTERYSYRPDRSTKTCQVNERNQIDRLFDSMQFNKDN